MGTPTLNPNSPTPIRPRHGLAMTASSSPYGPSSSSSFSCHFGFGAVVSILIVATFTFSAGFNLAFFLMTRRGGSDNGGGAGTHLPTMAEFISPAGGVGGLLAIPSDVARPMADPVSQSKSERGGGVVQLRGAEAEGDDEDAAATGGSGPPLLSCERYGGPPDDVASEMVYWKDIESDAHFVSPFRSSVGNGDGKEVEKKYLTFEPDVGGWNNIRMAMETVVALAHAMGRVLVMPAKKEMYLLTQEAAKHDNSLHFGDFFDLNALSEEHSGLEIISMEQFMKEQAITGKLKDKVTGEAKFPPRNRTNWDGLARNHEVDDVARYLRSVAVTPDWEDEHCMAAFPSKAGDVSDIEKLRNMYDKIMKKGLPSVSEMSRVPLPVDAPPEDRMRELILGRRLCVYDAEMQDAHLVHFRVDMDQGIRLLVHFYAFLFFEDWRHDLHLKRLVRDHLRYLDEIQCAAARVVAAVRDRARKNVGAGDNPDGLFDTMHIRRGDFQYHDTRLGADVLYNLSKAEVSHGTTLYIATDERDRSFFKPFSENYDVCFLGDFAHLFKGLSKNYYGMLDQLIASRGRTFYGTFYSTFTGYINRMRGYHADKLKKPGHEDGIVDSYYFFPKARKLAMRRYAPVHKAFWMREFPAAWRNIDKGADEL